MKIQTFPRGAETFLPHGEKRDYTYLVRPPRIHQGQDGTSFFVTTVTSDRKPIFRDHRNAQIAEEVILDYRRRGDYWLSEYVIMPDHVHVMITPRNHSLSRCLQHLKRTISQKIHETQPCGTETFLSHRVGRSLQKNLWQSSFHDILLRTPQHFDTFRNYIHHNPVQAGLCTHPDEYPFSSLQRETDRHHIAAGLAFPDNQNIIMIASSNPGKVREIREALHDLPHQFFDLTDFFYMTDAPAEEGVTFHDNALLKARHYHKLTGVPVVADDSGIKVEALNGELGVHTRRWGAGPQASDEEWIDCFLKRMKGEHNKRASFVCAIAYIDGEGREHVFEGRCSGVIRETLEADYLPGLPISACFLPDGYGAVFSALNIEQKNSTSHRGKAVEKLKSFLLRTHLPNTPIQ